MTEELAIAPFPGIRNTLSTLATRSNSNLTAGATLLTLALVVLLAYGHTLNDFFSHPDALTLIDTSRVSSFRDLASVFSDPFMRGTEFTKLALYYRPFTTLSYALDYVIWDLNPFGYHFTHLVLHIVGAFLVFLLARRLLPGSRIIPWLAAFTFSFHPTLALIVPAARQDMLAALFIMLSLLLFLQYGSNRRYRNAYFVGSILCYLIALGTREIAIILPPLVFAHSLIYSPLGIEFRSRVARAAQLSFPFVAVTLLALGWRTYVIEGIGGLVERPSNLDYIVQLFGSTLAHYSMDLMLPIPHLDLALPVPSALFGPTPSPLVRIGSLILVAAVLLPMLVYRRRLFGARQTGGHLLMRQVERLLLTIATLSLLTFLAYPVVAPYVNDLLQAAHEGKGPGFLVDALTKRESVPVERYFNKARDLILNLTLGALLLSGLLLLAIRSAGGPAGLAGSGTERSRALLFALAWLALPLGVYIVTLAFGHHGMYLPAIPFAILISIMLVEGIEGAAVSLRIGQTVQTRTRRTSLLLAAVGRHPGTWVLALVAVGIWASLLAMSPLLRRDDPFGDNARVSSMFLNRLSDAMAELPAASTIHVYDSPSWEYTNSRVGFGFKPFAIKSWVDLRHPDSDLEVVIESHLDLVAAPSSLDLEVRQVTANGREVSVRPRYRFGE